MRHHQPTNRNAVIYVRAGGYGEVHIRTCREYAGEHQLSVQAEFVDSSVTYYEDERPNLWAAIESLEDDAILLVASFAHLAENLYVSDIIEEAVTDRGAAIVSASGETDWPDDRGATQSRAILRQRASWYRSARQSRKHSHRLRRLARVPAPFGWSRSDSAEGLSPVDAEQNAIRLIQQWREAGVGLREIARRLDDAGVPCRGRRWHHMTVQRILARAGARHGTTQASVAR